MTAESEESLIRRMNEAIAAGDVDSFDRGLHPDVVWEHNPGAGSPEEGTYRGRAEVVALFGRIIEPWEQLRAEPAEINRLEDGVYLIKGELRAKHASTSTEIVTPYEQRLEIRDGRLAKGRMTTGQAP